MSLMPMTPMHPCTRRAVLTGGLAGAVTVLIGAAAASAAPGGGAEVALPREMLLLSLGGGKEMLAPAYLGAVITPVGTGLSAGSVIELTWDDRVYQAGPAFLFGPDRDLLRCRAEPMRADGGSSSRRARVTLPVSLGAGRAYHVLLGTRRQSVASRDAVPDPRPLVVAVPGQPTSRRAAPATVRDRGKGWTAALGVTWASRELPGAGQFWLPRSLNLRSAGELAIPAGTIVGVRLDRRMAETVRWLSSGRIVPARVARPGGRLLQVEFTLPAAVPPGRSRAFEIGITGSGPHRDPGDLEPTLLYVKNPRAGGTQHGGGQESTARAAFEPLVVPSPPRT